MTVYWNGIYPPINAGGIADLQSCENLALDVLNVFFKVVPDQNVIALYRLFLYSKEPDLGKAELLIKCLMKRYNSKKV